MIPLEAAIVAISKVIEKSLEYAGTHRATMSPENRDKWDSLQNRLLEKWVNFLDLFDKENRKL